MGQILLAPSSRGVTASSAWLMRRQQRRGQVIGADVAFRDELHQVIEKHFLE